ncbi:hypothetical protein PQO03_06380 [Lentisphaera profundi]|uniref:Uncharacterized protein n=1 Tax=Lentisphaera profundi TaxID=1658616 RepID=A0ABY7VMT5_9BACT|nr:hypothetical protein [Lentisphaera profundi]WDE95346.1 hypothetical protein PQO03_06380 [Lentisphaera profundi]
MKRIMCIMMAGLFALVFSLGDIPLYSCVKKNSFHVMKSCCEAKQEIIKPQKTCCADKNKVVTQTEVTLNGICCKVLEHQVDSPLLLEGELKLVFKSQLISSMYFDLPNKTRAIIRSLKSSLVNKGPPKPDLNRDTFPLAIFKLYNSYRC